VASGVNGGVGITSIVKRFALISPAVEAQQPDRRWIILAVFAALAVIVVGAILISRSGGDDDGDSTSASSGGSKGGCEKVEAPAPKNVGFDKPDQVVEKGEKVNAVVKTSCGEFTIALDTERAPKTSNSFAFLAEEGFFDETTFHRIVPEFVIQGGDPEGTGGGGPGYSVVEAPPSNIEYTKGIVAMAKTETEAPGTSGSQFYVVTGANVGLPPEYALLGEVTDGYPTVEKIEKQAKPGTEEPKQPVVIESVTVEKE
jgi:peptidyl-prolyl cis-trans isomerase B (cyclophilin B)